ncbi:MAG: hypothetical protein NWS20_00650 [Rickettsiaceae bacterium]|nr:hypothetical protein [Rickettsiaceae bacterium]MDP4832907.1 hypothetical protein [Rickettsiaceae bacterium]MDP5021136.1 hypothetical protein [Rickettsiaceae bacterium]MDP5082700.1 hypothetical protein [Rickettsiaceae bacterium]
MICTNLHGFLQNPNQYNAIKLEREDIDIDGVIAIAAALKDNPSVTKVTITGQQLGLEGITVLAEAFKTNNSITEINLSSNDINPEGATKLAEVVKNNHSITKLILSDNYLGNEGVTTISEALKTNNSITGIDISHNRIKDEGYAKFIETLKTNNSITKIDISENYNSDEAIDTLITALKINHSITSICHFATEEASQEDVDTINQLLERNKKIFSDTSFMLETLAKMETTEALLAELEKYALNENAALLREFHNRPDAFAPLKSDKGNETLQVIKNFVLDNYFQIYAVAKDIFIEGSTFLVLPLDLISDQILTFMSNDINLGPQLAGQTYEQESNAPDYECKEVIVN